MHVLERGGAGGESLLQFLSFLCIEGPGGRAGERSFAAGAAEFTTNFTTTMTTTIQR